MKGRTMPLVKVLLVSDRREPAAAMRQTMQAAGFEVSGPVDSRSLEPSSLHGCDATLVDAGMAHAIPCSRRLLGWDGCPVFWFAGADVVGGTALEVVAQEGVCGIVSPAQPPTAVRLALLAGLAGFHRREGLRRRVVELAQRVEERKQIERAKGYLMDRYGLNESEAYQRMRRAAMNQRRSIREIAQHILTLSEVTDGWRDGLRRPT
ncbi:MAG: ANTAR domain-containing protein [Clostridia bacterium]|nr:ANTAR domain-containing protein [Clostridia bacterium]